jgi:hypothetical protein
MEYFSALNTGEGFQKCDHFHSRIFFLQSKCRPIRQPVPSYEGGPKNNRNLNGARELEVVARCVARCRESTQYSSSLPRCVSLG